jgi:hypothetical protein
MWYLGMFLSSVVKGLQVFRGQILDSGDYWTGTPTNILDVAVIDLVESVDWHDGLKTEDLDRKILGLAQKYNVTEDQILNTYFTGALQQGYDFLVYDPIVKRWYVPTNTPYRSSDGHYRRINSIAGYNQIAGRTW